MYLMAYRCLLCVVQIQARDRPVLRGCQGEITGRHGDRGVSAHLWLVVRHLFAGKCL